MHILAEIIQMRSILEILKKFKINYSKADEKLIAKYISQGKVIGRCGKK